MTDPLDLVQGGCDRNHQGSGKHRRAAAIKGDDRHFSIVDSDWNRQEKPQYFQYKHAEYNSAVMKTLLLPNPTLFKTCLQGKLATLHPLEKEKI